MTTHNIQGAAYEIGKYASVNGLQMYYEVHGTGRPMVLLHGALSTIDINFGDLIRAFATDRQVIAVEQQAHGHTADIDRPLSYRQMAEDTVELLRQLEIEEADFLGYSMGGGIALQIVLEYPELVGKVVFAGGASFSPDGLYPEILTSIEHLTPEILKGSLYHLAYEQVAPKVEGWHHLIERVKTLDLDFVGWASEVIESIRKPILLIIGDSDIVRPEHTLTMFRLLGGCRMSEGAVTRGSQLAILPGTTHEAVIERVEWLVSMCTAFWKRDSSTSVR